MSSQNLIVSLCDLPRKQSCMALLYGGSVYRERFLNGTSLHAASLYGGPLHWGVPVGSSTVQSPVCSILYRTPLYRGGPCPCMEFSPNFNFLCDLVYCEPLLEVKNATNETDTSSRTVGTVIRLRCNAGHVFPDDSQNVTVHCNAEGEWMWDTAPKNSHCSGSKTTNFSLLCACLVLIYNCWNLRLFLLPFKS